MKKLFNILLVAAAALGFATSCSDVPMPYNLNAGGSSSFGKQLPYKSSNLNSGWTTYSITSDNPWSLGSNYVQATGYQKWDGSDSKSNRAVEGYLISPAIYTSATSGKVKMTFDHVIMYASRDSDYKNHVGVSISKDYDGKNFNKATWTKIPFEITSQSTPSTTDWTCYTIPEVQIPDEFVNCDSVYFAFYMKSASADQSISWEIQNFIIMEGVAEGSGSTTPDTPAETLGSKTSPLKVAEAMTKSGNGYVTGYIVGYVDGQSLNENAKFEAAAASETEILIADAADCKDVSLCFPVQLPAGDLRTALNPNIASNIGKLVTVYGSIENYFGTKGMKATSWAVLDGKEIGKDPEATETPAADAKGDGSEKNPFNVSGVINFTKALAADTNSKEIYFEGIVCNDPSIDTGNYGNATCYISDDGTANNQFYCFRIFDFKGEKFTDAAKFKKGDKVVIYGPVVNYKGNTPETAASKCYLVSINGKSEGGSVTPDTPDPTPSAGGAVTIDGTNVSFAGTAEAGTESVTVDLSTFGYENQQEVTTVTVDGATITFDANGETNAPKYYTATKGVRVYAREKIIINGKANIASVKFECDAYNGTNYVGNATATASIDGKTATYVNHIDSGSGVQLRVKVITITYAK